MTNPFEGISLSTAKNQEEVQGLMKKLIATAQPESVFSPPVSAGEYTLITASEAWISAGFGGGGGHEEINSPSEKAEISGGSGFGGGGMAMGRPVAAISIGPRGVRVEPIVDPTKIVLAFFTLITGMLMMWYRMKRANKS